jgi:prolipoprotein diacylglyceryltransferase
VPTGVIVFDFDPLLRLTDTLVVRWQTVALATVIAAVILAAGVIARRSGLRPDDLLYLVVGVVPGAVVGGRIGYALVHLDTFGPRPLALLDPAQPGLELAGAVLGGLLSGACVASLLGAPLARWAHLLAVPLLVALGAGKLTMVLGGSGQGLPFDGAWATSYVGPGPWGSLAPALPSHPSQAYEGLATVVLALLFLGALTLGAFARRDGRLLLVAIAAWAFVRAAVSVTWRDPVVAPPFGAAGLLAIALGLLCLAGAVAMGVVRVRRDGTDEAAAAAADAPRWPDPESRPPF